ncbi:transglutaminase domain-containing protein [Clostridium cellulovorans]|uniref:Transglutaminase-like domain-containing protein n=1 Tax=Clostridium cellulovorans (strain ATCC 35296 / DSM 3052 / OCM 3 / 743B) TaxID=573061 RepID=D9SN68_CLOC7|nr:transglutaminase domain-containing protein [Clostridium cellulovorans]ADL51934.1 hypothetical protein Clocel_2193 [Clostridium cellulovorans 743B]
MNKLNKLLAITLVLNSMLFNVDIRGTELPNTQVKTASLQLNDFDNSTTKTLDYSANTYATSTADGLAITEAIYNGLVNFQQTIDLSAFASVIDTPQIPLDLYCLVYKQAPDLFYISNNVRCSYTTDQNGKIVSYKLYISYLYDIPTCKIMKQKLDAKVNYIKENYLDLVDSEVQKEYVIHDYLIENCTYDSQSVSSGNVPLISHTSYAALINGKAVCDGYSKAASLLFEKCGIESGIIESAPMNHAWNIVKIEGVYYHLDVTWDDPVPESNKNRYAYFNCSDNEMNKDHSWVPVDSIAAPSNKFSFLRSYSYIARTEDTLNYKVGNSLTYTNLYGANSTNELLSFVTNDFVGDRKNIYYINGSDVDGRTANCVMKYNVVKNTNDILFKTSGTITDIYKNDSGIVVKYTENNILLTTVLSTKLDEDINRDGIIDIKDLATIASKYNVSLKDTSYKSLIDFNRDGLIDIFDIVKITHKL